MRDLCEGVEEHRSRGQAGYAGDEFCRGEEVAGRGGVLKATGNALRAGLKNERASREAKAQSPINSLTFGAATSLSQPVSLPKACSIIHRGPSHSLHRAMEISGVRHTVLRTPMNSRQPPISNRAQFLQLTRQTRMLYYAECSNRPKGEERIAQGFSPGNAYATKSPSKGVQVR
jgi:hypothetical protein